jgi:hypothetical protein
MNKNRNNFNGLTHVGAKMTSLGEKKNWERLLAIGEIKLDIPSRRAWHLKRAFYIPKHFTRWRFNNSWLCEPVDNKKRASSLHCEFANQSLLSHWNFLPLSFSANFIRRYFVRQYGGLFVCKTLRLRDKYRKIVLHSWKVFRAILRLYFYANKRKKTKLAKIKQTFCNR